MNRVFKLIGILLVSLLGAFSHQLHAQVLLTAPATSTTGAYTVQSNTAAGCWTGTNGIDYCGWLVEYQNGVQIATFPVGDSWSFSGKSSGTYTYEAWYTATNNGVVVAGGVVASTSVVVSIPPPGGGQSCTSYPAAPGNMMGHSAGTYSFLVTGANGGGWGTGNYTDDSYLPAMAVHAGLVTVGGQAVIQVSKSGGLSAYTGSTQNGISTSSYGAWSGTYSLALIQSCGTAPPPPSSTPATIPAFTSQTGVTPSALVESNAVTVSGFSSTLTAQASGDGGVQLSVNGGSWTTSSSITTGSTVKLRLQAAPTASTARSATLTIGSSSAGWSVTTAAGTSPQCQNIPVAPGNMMGHSAGTYSFLVTGTTSGSGWGTGNYTDDSSLSAMAVHAGLVAPGSQAVIRVTKFGGLSSYSGSTQNGVTTSSWGSWSGSYSLAAETACSVAPPPPPTVSLSLTPAAIPLNTGVATATWTSTNATSCTMGSGSAAGSTGVGPYSTTGTKTESITCTGPGGSASATAQLQVLEIQPVILSVTGEQGANTIQGGQITIMQDQPLRLELLVLHAVSCEVGTLELPVPTTPTGGLAKIELGAFYFDAGLNVLSLHCFSANGYQSPAQSVQVTVIENPANPKTPLPVIQQLSVGGVNFLLPNQVLTIAQNQPIPYTIAPAVPAHVEYCDVHDGLTHARFEPANFVGSLQPYRFPVGDYEYLFYCAGKGGTTSLIYTIRLNITAPGGGAPLPPTDPSLINDNYSFQIDTASSRLKIIPANPAVSTLGEFVLPYGTNYGVLQGSGSAGNWASISSIDYEMGDYNADGLDDILIRNIPNRDPHIVYANQFGTTPKDWVVVDQQFRQFFEELYGIVLNPNYIQQNYAEGEYYEYNLGYKVSPSYCGFDWYFGTFNTNCWFGINWVPYLFVHATVFSGKLLPGGGLGEFHPMTTTALADAVTNVLNAGELAPNADGQLLAGVLEQVLRTRFMAGVLSSDSGSLLPGEFLVPPDLLNSYRAGQLASLATDCGSPWIKHITAGDAACVVAPFEPTPLGEVICVCYRIYKVYQIAKATIEVLDQAEQIIVAEMGKDDEINDEEIVSRIAAQAYIEANYENAGCRMVYRGTDELTPREFTFEHGMIPLGKHYNLWDHVFGPPSIFISATKFIERAALYPVAGTTGWVYVIVTDRGIDVNLSISDLEQIAEDLYDDHEVSIPFGVKPNEIAGAYRKILGSVQYGEYHSNSRFNPPCTP